MVSFNSSLKGLRKNKVKVSFWWLYPSVFFLLALIFALTTSQYMAYLATSWAIFGLLAFSLDIIWGKGGDLSLGQTVFFGVGAYTYGIVAINLAPILGNSLLLAVLFGGLSGVLVSGVVGYFIYYGRLGPLQTTIITYTMVLIMATVAISTSFELGSARVGGANGMTSIPPLSADIFGFNSLTRHGALVATLTIIFIVTLLVVAVLKKPFGLVIDGTRQDVLKTELLGYDVRKYRLALFTIAGCVAGVAGGLYSSWAGYVSPSIFAVTQALLIPIYVLVGGRGSLYGGFLGALFIGWLTFWLGGGVAGGQTTLILGAILILLVLFVPKGASGLINVIIGKAVGKKNAYLDEVSHAPDLGKLKSFLEEPEEKMVILETKGLNKKFGGVVATDNVSMSFYNKGIHCLIGPNGAGKSTYLNTCIGLIKPDSGNIFFQGEKIERLEPCQRVQLGMGIKLQVAKVLEEQTVWENLWLSSYSKNKNKVEANEIVYSVSDIIGLRHKLFVNAEELSHGEQQWLDIGMVLSLKPKVIFLDEPAAGMTKIERDRTVQILHILSKFVGVVVVEHDMDFIRALESPVTVLHQGAVFTSGSIEELRQNPEVLDIYLGRQKDA
ncbi:MAG: ABC transporter permease subunit [Pseudomonadota bacterium]